MKFSFCKKCAQVTMSDRSQYFLVVQPVPRCVLKSFASFEAARTFARHTSPSARVETHEREEICKICNGDK